MSNQTFDSHSQSSSRSHFSTLRSLGEYLWVGGRNDLKIRVVIAVVLLVMAEVASVYTPYILKYIVDDMTGDVNPVIVMPAGLIVAFGVARVLTQAFAELRDAVFAKVGQNAIRQVALNTFQHLHRLSLRFHLDRQTGGLSRVIERGTKGIDFLLRFMLFNIAPTLLKILFICGILLVQYGWLMSVITLVTLVSYIFFTLTVTEWRLKYRRTMNEKDSEANTKAIDSLLNFETVKYFGNEGHEARRFDKALASYETAAVKSNTTLAYLNIGQGFIISAGLIAVLILSARGVVAGEYTVGDFVAIHAFMMLLVQPLNFLGFVYREIKQSLVDMEKMFELLTVSREIADIPAAKPLAEGGGDVEFHHVDFGYEDNRQILHDVSFRVPSGKTTAIVGPSGAGKSTISRILFRFYDVDKGYVTIDGQKINEVTQDSLRAAIGIVPQDTVLFNDTIRYNIAYGRPGATDAEIEAAARLASIDKLIEKLPDGYNTMVGERGLKLSGGEKQRVAIARAILKQPRILLFDEATSALDSHTEKEIQASLAEVSKNRTTLVIAHRLSTVVEADEIIVLENGIIQERGRHKDLLAKEGKYAAMWKRQQEAATYQEKLEQVLD
ncbi:ABCB family ABC transporter ATP-binding protein/permease [Sneathiella sp. HT1-7]|uniref:ABCB family ABC transporter ATP-binding protein/permease n=1 Tax=Sneathiella sp. HT1-7 TaxID=2887192 RepID=UPI001D14D994|nr:ABC transporter ATP-binding protein/permease [Sneathiella sp. HT1-7]MCC3306261.1 ABC transporter ATP-binding protein/permease [Sneathiella sp. HT1-7]